jgi:hypothetical protein
MVRYICNKCNKEFDHKGNYYRHINRKRSCKSNNIFKVVNKQKEQKEPKKVVDNDLEKIKKLLNLINNSDSENLSDNSSDYEKPQCKFCNIIFHNKSNLNRHLRKGCKDYYDEEIKKKLREKDEEVEKLKKEIDKLKMSQHITNNINVIAYNKTPDLSHLTNNDYLKIMNKGFSSVPKLIEAIHYNPNKPENQNVYIPNIKNNYAMIWNGDKWNLGNQDEIIEDMYDDKSNILIEKMEEIEKVVSNKYPSVVKKFRRFIDGKDDDTIKNKIKQDIKLLLYNNKEMIKNTKK